MQIFNRKRGTERHRAQLFLIFVVLQASLKVILNKLRQKHCRNSQ